jgi:glycosyltransferase involved in cell wall biosynthesis
MKTTKKILLVFPEEHLAYSPTTLNIFRELKKHFDTRLIAFVPYKRSTKRIEEEGIMYIDAKKWYRKPLKAFLFLYSLFHKEMGRDLLKKMGMSSYYRLFLLKRAIASLVEHREIIAVDFMTAWLCQTVYKKDTHFLSLEIVEQDPFFKKLTPKKILSVIIQNEERYHYLFDNQPLPTFFIQNAPKFQDFKPMRPEDRRGILFSGAAERGFGIFACLDFLAKYPQFNLTLKGSMLQEVKEKIETEYGELLLSGRLQIDKSYLEQVDLNEYLHKFRIGFCFYDTQQTHMNTFNYRTAPSGKLFQYHASGIPVVASNLPGLSSVSTFHTGIMIDDLAPETIYNAIEKIESEYDQLVENSFKAGRHYDFNTAILPFLHFLKQQEPSNH